MVVFSLHIWKYKNYLLYLLLFFCLNIIICSDDLEINYILNNDIFELNSSYIIDQIILTKENNNSYNYLLGLFLASNDITFYDALPIAIIKEENINNISSNEINININSTTPYKYIRYIPPNNIYSNITNIKIFGHEYYEDSQEKNIFKMTNLPLIIINTENSTEPNTKKNYTKCQIIIINNNIIDLNQSASIKLRGQSTSTYPKKPYKIKFDKKQEILGFSGKYKK